MFAYRSKDTYSRLRLDTDGKTLVIHVEGIPLEIGFDGKQLRFEVGSLRPRHLPLPLGSTVGQIGLWARNNGKSPFSSRFARYSLSHR